MTRLEQIREREKKGELDSTGFIMLLAVAEAAVRTYDAAAYGAGYTVPKRMEELGRALAPLLAEVTE